MDEGLLEVLTAMQEESRAIADMCREVLAELGQTRAALTLLTASLMAALERKGALDKEDLEAVVQGLLERKGELPERMATALREILHLPQPPTAEVVQFPPKA